MKFIKSISDVALLTCLFLLALFIWFRDTSWISSSDDTLPILVALPLFLWVGSPWTFRDDPQAISTKWIAVSAPLFFLGIALNVTFILTAGWVALLWAWLRARLTKENLESAKKLLILPFMAFPWVTLDADRIGWWFRLSGAWVTAKFYELLGYDVKQEGTQLLVNKITISVEVACAGLNTLQSMLIAGSVVCYLILGHTNRYWWNLLLLVFMSWFANTVRIIFISGAALWISPKFATGEFHVWGGWALLLFMFCLCWFIFNLQKPKESM